MKFGLESALRGLEAKPFSIRCAHWIEHEIPRRALRCPAPPAGFSRKLIRGRALRMTRKTEYRSPIDTMIEIGINFGHFDPCAAPASRLTLMGIMRRDGSIDLV
jgi:hypothetical protein